MIDKSLEGLVNLKYIQELTEGDNAALEHLISVYLRETQLDLQKLERALVEGQRAEVHRLSHGCKGASALYGILALVHPLEEIEHLARNGKLQDVHPWLEEAKRLYAVIEKGLKDFIKTLHSPTP